MERRTRPRMSDNRIISGGTLGPGFAIIRTAVRRPRGMDTAQFQESIGAAAGQDIDDAIARLAPLIGIHQQDQLLLLGHGAMVIGGDDAPREAVIDMFVQPSAFAGQEIPDIGFDRIIEFVVAVFLAVDIAELDFGEKLSSSQADLRQIWMPVSRLILREATTPSV